MVYPYKGFPYLCTRSGGSKQIPISIITSSSLSLCVCFLYPSGFMFYFSILKLKECARGYKELSLFVFGSLVSESIQYYTKHQFT